MYKESNLKTMLNEMLDTVPGIYSIAVQDLATGRELLINPGKLRSASLIKLFIMIEAFRQASLGQIFLEETVIIQACDQVGGAGPLEHVSPGTQKTWSELVELMIIESDNTATNILIRKLTMTAINTTIQSLGCPDTLLQRNMMDFASAANGWENYTSVVDVAQVLEKLYFHRCLNSELDETMLAILKNQQDRCKIPQGLPQGTIVAHKTGELDGVEHDAGIIYHPEKPFLLIIMTENLPDPLCAQTTIAALTKTVYQYISNI
ncbi:MAG: per1 [Firmicutes bacterium]|nr:per1 [Bacillota bacterium]